MPQRIRQILLIGSMAWLSWLAMTLIHECGHVVGALSTGGTVQQLVWYPTVLSRTDVSPNPHVLLETWAGPLLGSFVPVLFAILMVVIRSPLAYLFLFFVGFCLIANGAYLGIGAAWPVGDAKVLLVHGTPRIALGVFGAGAVVAGFFVWGRISPRFGFGTSPNTISSNHAVWSVLASVILTAICWLAGQSGV